MGGSCGVLGISFLQRSDSPVAVLVPNGRRMVPLSTFMNCLWLSAIFALGHPGPRGSAAIGNKIAMSLTHRILRATLRLLSPALACATLPASGVDTVLRTESWETHQEAFAACERRIAALHPRNLIARAEARLVDGPASGHGVSSQLTDGTAGVFIGKGRVLPAGKPAVLTYYLGRPVAIRQAGVFTFNSDTRANQHWEVRFAKSVELPGIKPDFSQVPALSTGNSVLGKNTGGFHACFRAKDGGNLTPEPVDWVEFRIWPTLGIQAGTKHARDGKGRDGPSALVELEVLSDESSPRWEPEERYFRDIAQLEALVAQCYRKKANWRQTLLEAREAVEKGLPGAQDAPQRLWSLVERDFSDPASRSAMERERADGIWNKAWVPGDFRALALRYASACRDHLALHREMVKLAQTAASAAGLEQVQALYDRSCRLREAWDPVRSLDWGALQLAVEDLLATFGSRYPKGREFLERIAGARRAWEADNMKTALTEEDVGRIVQLSTGWRQLQRAALMANPLLDFEELLLVRRSENRLGMPANWQSNSSLPKTGYDNEIVRLCLRQPDEKPGTVYRPSQGEFIGDVDLHFDARRLLVSMPAEGGTGDWHVFELNLNEGGLRNLTASMGPGINNYDACYLPDGRIAFTSTAGMVAVPCVRGSSLVATLFRMNADGSNPRQLCFDQEHSWCPTLLHDGRILYTRWEYADLPHSNSRMLFTSNPDGTSQRAYYGSGSFWPNSIFYARPVPGHPTMVAGTITGHHAPARMGELILFDPARGTREAEGVVQRIPGHREKVEPLIQDGLTASSWPKFLHPFPLSERYLIVSAKPSPERPWGVYLADVFNNLLLIREEAGQALLEPVPLRKTARPPVIPDRIQPERKDAVMLVSDIYAGPGLGGIPRGEVQRLRLYTYTFGYPGVGGLYGSIGMDGPWDMRRVLGTVPVAPDGSVVARIPANTPIAIQPLDREGKALQIMRSWFTAMPGETLSCAGCHESMHDTPSMGFVAELNRPPAEIEPWRGPVRNYEFVREVQPVLDQYCAGCHDGEKEQMDLRGTAMVSGWSTRMPGNTGAATGGKFSRSYANLHRYVRRPGIESPMPLQTPMEFHADTTELVQILAKGHHRVKLDEEAWDRLVTWIDLNAPFHGRWSTLVGEGIKELEERRASLRACYAKVEENHEQLPDAGAVPVRAAVLPPPEAPPPPPPAVAGWPMSPQEAAQLQAQPGRQACQIDLGGGVIMDLAYIPSGAFPLGSVTGFADEFPVTRVNIAKGFWMAKQEVTNRQFRQFQPRHDSREEDRHGYQFGIPGYSVNGEDMPAVRLSWNQASEFCQWLSAKSGKAIALPTEAQWEWACRAGTASPFWFGGLDTDFSPYANLGDATLADFSGDPYTLDRTKARFNNPENPFDNWIPQDARFHDGGFVSEPVGKYRPNPWGLCDMHGNVAEWTASPYRPYPYREPDAQASSGPVKRVVRGGSWYDRPKRCTSSYRFGYREYQKVFNVGFRVIMVD